MSINLDGLFSAWQVTSLDPRVITVVLFLFGCFVVYKMIADGDWISKVIGVGLLVLAFKIFVVLALLAVLIMPRPAYACDNWSLTCLIGLDDIAARDAQRRETEAQLNVQIQANLNTANQELERIRNARYESDNQRMIAIRNAELQYDQYRAQLASQRDIMVKQLDAQISASADQAAIAQRGIMEAAGTARSRIAWENGATIASIVVIGGIVAILILAIARVKVANIQAQPRLTAVQMQLLQDYARTTGKQLRVIDGEYYLSDGQRTVKALLKG